jgi:hypothetical protein
MGCPKSCAHLRVSIPEPVAAKLTSQDKIKAAAQVTSI